MSINPAKCYWSNSFIVQGNQERVASAHPFKGPANARMNVNTEKCLRKKKYDFIEK